MNEFGNVGYHDDVLKWKHFPRYWPFVGGNSPDTGEFPSQRPVTQSFLRLHSDHFDVTNDFVNVESTLTKEVYAFHQIYIQNASEISTNNFMQ